MATDKNNGNAHMNYIFLSKSPSKEHDQFAFSNL